MDGNGETNPRVLVFFSRFSLFNICECHKKQRNVNNHHSILPAGGNRKFGLLSHFFQPFFLFPSITIEEKGGPASTSSRTRDELLTLDPSVEMPYSRDRVSPRSALPRLGGHVTQPEPMVRSQLWSKARAPVSGGDGRTESGRERNKAKAESTLIKPLTKYSHHVRGEAKGESRGGERRAAWL